MAKILEYKELTDEQQTKVSDFVMNRAKELIKEQGWKNTEHQLLKAAKIIFKYLLIVSPQGGRIVTYDMEAINKINPNLRTSI